MQRGRKASNSDKSYNEQHQHQLADNTCEPAAFQIRHVEPRYKEGTPGTWEYQALATLKFHTEDNELFNVKFTHTLLLDADVPQLSINGTFDRKCAETDVQEHLTEVRSTRTTTVKRRTPARMPSGCHSHRLHASPRQDQEQIKKLIEEGLKKLVRHFEEEHREWTLSEGMHRSAAAATRGTQQSAGAKAGMKNYFNIVTIVKDYIYIQLYRWRGGAVAQRVERWTCDQQVVGSNPTRGKSCVTTLGKLFTPMCLCHQAV